MLSPIVILVTKSAKRLWQEGGTGWTLNLQLIAGRFVGWAGKLNRVENVSTEKQC